MTIEIKELVIKATVGGGAQPGTVTENKNQSGEDVDTQKIVALCVAEVLKILKREKER